jgi:hypothetical protein
MSVLVPHIVPFLAAPDHPLVASRRQVISLIRGVLQLPHKTPYLDKAVDYEALSVQRNAPRWLKMLIKHGYMPTPA